MTKMNNQLLEQLLKDTEMAVASLEPRIEAGKQATQNIETLTTSLQHDETVDERGSLVRVQVLQAKLDELRSDAQQEEKDLAQAVLGINAMIENLGGDYAELSSLNNDEEGLIAKAESNLELARAHRSKAETKWFFKDTAIAKADQSLAEATEALEQARRDARSAARKRLLDADMEASLQEFMTRVERTVAIMESRMLSLDGQLKAVSRQKEKAYSIKSRAAKALEELDKQLDQDEEQLRRNEDILESLDSGSQEYVDQLAVISEGRASVESLRGQRNTAFVLYQSKEKFVAELEIHERSQMKLRDNQRMWITSLRSDTEERVITFRSRLEAMKAASDQEVAKSLDDMGTEADLRNAEYMVKIGAVSDRARMTKLEKHPQRIKQISQIAAAQAEAISRIRERERIALEHFRELYGIDPLTSSFFHYDEAQEDNRAAAHL